MRQSNQRFLLGAVFAAALLAAPVRAHAKCSTIVMSLGGVGAVVGGYTGLVIETNSLALENLRHHDLRQIDIHGWGGAGIGLVSGVALGLGICGLQAILRKADVNDGAAYAELAAPAAPSRDDGSRYASEQPSVFRLTPRKLDARSAFRKPTLLPAG